MYLQGARDDSELGRRLLAARMAAEFGTPAEALAQGLARGRLRVKRGATDETAQALAARLGSLGGLAVIVPEGSDPQEAQAAATSARPLETSGAPRLVSLDGAVDEHLPPPASAFAPDAFGPGDDDKPIELGRAQAGAVRARVPTAPAPALAEGEGSADENQPQAEFSAGEVSFNPPAPADFARSTHESADDAESTRMGVGRPTPEPATRAAATRAAAADDDDLDRRAVLRLALPFAVGLVSGLLPAAFYARGVQLEEVRPLKVREVALISQAPPSTAGDVPPEAHEVRVRIRAIKTRAAFWIVLLWAGVGGGVGWAVRRFT